MKMDMNLRLGQLFLTLDAAVLFSSPDMVGLSLNSCSITRSIGSTKIQCLNWWLMNSVSFCNVVNLSVVAEMKILFKLLEIYMHVYMYINVYFFRSLQKQLFPLVMYKCFISVLFPDRRRKWVGSQLLEDYYYPVNYWIIIEYFNVYILEYLKFKIQTLRTIFIFTWQTAN